MTYKSDVYKSMMKPWFFIKTSLWTKNFIEGIWVKLLLYCSYGKYNIALPFSRA